MAKGKMKAAIKAANDKLRSSSKSDADYVKKLQNIITGGIKNSGMRKEEKKKRERKRVTRTDHLKT